MIMFFLTLTILSLFSLTHASPLFPRIVFNPNITVPDANTVWEVGTTQMVKWDVTGLPDESLKGTVVLGHIAADDPDNENLMLNPPLAKGFLLRDGQIAVTIPDIPPRTDYIVVVFGDSGNASPKFTIKNPNQSGSTVTASSTSSLAQSTTITDPIPITGTTITGSLPADPSTTITPMTSISQLSTISTGTAPPTLTKPTSTPGGGSSTVSSSSSGASGTSADSRSGNNAAWKVSSKQPFTMIAFAIAISLVL